MNMRNKNKLSNTNLLDAIFNDGLQDAYSKEAMGVSGDKTARKYEISRDEQDDFAIQSYKRSAKAWEEGKFKDEIVPVEVPQRRGRSEERRVGQEKRWGRVLSDS